MAAYKIKLTFRKTLIDKQIKHNEFLLQITEQKTEQNQNIIFIAVGKGRQLLSKACYSQLKYQKTFRKFTLGIQYFST